MSGIPAELGPNVEPRLVVGVGAGVPVEGRRVFLGNFTCELEWAGEFLKGRSAGSGSGGLLVSLADRLRPRNAELAWSWLPVVRAGDVVLGVAPPAQSLPEMWFPGLPPDRLQGLAFHRQPPAGLSGTLVPWGWTAVAHDLAGALGQPPTIPPLNVVARVNSRVQRWLWEQELGLALPGSQVIASLNDLSLALRDLPASAAGWILKANFGMSGREAIRGAGDTVTEPQRRFIEQRLAATGPLVLEPLLQAVAEAGVQWELSANGTIALVGVAEQVVAGGSWQGSGWSNEPGPPTWGEAIEATRPVAQRVAAAGYFGPLGIDVMRYRDPAGHERLRPLQDLNARFTMGRLTLGWRDWLPAGWSGLWRVYPGSAVPVVRQFCEEVAQAGDREVVAWLTTPIASTVAEGPQERRLKSARIRLSPTPTGPSPLGESSATKSLPSVRVLLAAADPLRQRRLEAQLAARWPGVGQSP